MVIIKLDKHLQTTWALSKHFSTSSTGWFFVSAVTSDNSGNTIISYTGDGSSGLCKISPAGSIVLDKQYSSTLASKLLSIGPDRYLGLSTTPYYSSGNTMFTSYVFDNQFNITKAKKYMFDTDLVDIAGSEATPLSNYNQLLTGDAAFQYISLGGLNFHVMSNSYFVADTTGRLLHFRNVPGTSNDAPAQSASVGSTTGSYLVAADTAGNTLYTKDLSVSDLNPLGAPVAAGNDLFFGCSTLGSQGIAQATDLVKFRNDGFLFCPGAGSATIPIFSDLAFYSIGASIPTLSTGTLTLQPSVIDTMTTTPVTAAILCTTTTAVNEVIQTGKGFVYYTGNYTTTVSLPANVQDATLVITDLNGRIMFKNDLNNAKQTIQLPEMPAGIYTWQLFYTSGTGQQRDAGKLAIQ